MVPHIAVKVKNIKPTSRAPHNVKGTRGIYATGK
jgi:hypothetical protein